MIRFFRKIRQSLLNGGKTSQYIKYAIGEIFLVVVGILIALQINTWNQNRILQSEISTALQNIHNEFLQNKKLIEKPNNDLNKSMETGKTLMRLMGRKPQVIEQQNIDYLLFQLLEGAKYRPTQKSISDLIQSGRLQLIPKNNLKHLIYQWTRQYESYQRQSERYLQKLDEIFVPYLSINYSMKDVDVYGDLKWKNKTILKVNKFQIFNDIEFENILDDYLYRINLNVKSMEQLKVTISKIIEATEPKSLTSTTQ